jgi:hypothetical protein
MPFSGAPGEMPQLLDETVIDTLYWVGRLRLTIWKRTLRVLCALALAHVAFGHHHVETGPRLSDP